MTGYTARMAKASLTSRFTFSQKVGVLRIIFGLVWAIDAAFKFEPAFYRSILNTVKAVASGQPTWLNFWFHTWTRIIGSNPHFFAIIVAVIEALIALSLIFGLARRLNYALAGVFSFLVWGIAEGFGGPYVAGSTDISAAIIYVFVFAGLYLLDSQTPPSWSLDNYLTKRISWWHVIANPGDTSHLKK